MWIFYNILFPVVFLLLMPHFLWRMLKRGGYRKGCLQRFGLYKKDLKLRFRERRRIWLHAVSVGEVFVALRFIEEFRARSPESAFVLTTTTSTGYAIAKKRVAPDDITLYFPIDFPLIMRSVLNRLDPSALIIVECELWPNLIRLAKSRGIPVMLLNGRISERSYRGYSKIGIWVKDVLQSFSLLCAQDQETAERLSRLGAARDKIKIFGSAKYDVAVIPSKDMEAAGKLLTKQAFGFEARIFTGGSTWRGEETILLNMYKKLKTQDPEARLILVPRHAERADEIQEEIKRNGFSMIRRRAITPDGLDFSADVLLVDTTGEMQLFYAVANLIFVGKSLAAHGGQNIIEPAVFAKPVVIGPNMENFSSITNDFISAEAIIQVADEKELEEKVFGLWNDEERRAELGRRAKELVHKKAGSISASVNFFLEQTVSRS